MQGEITIDELAIMINLGFKEIRADLTNLENKVDEKFAKIDERFAKIDERFAKIDERFEKMDKRFDIIEVRLSGIQNQIDNVVTNYPNRREYDFLGGRVKKIERKLGIASA